MQICADSCRASPALPPPHVGPLPPPLPLHLQLGTFHGPLHRTFHAPLRRTFHVSSTHAANVPDAGYSTTCTQHTGSDPPGSLHICAENRHVGADILVIIACQSSSLGISASADLRLRNVGDDVLVIVSCQSVIIARHEESADLC